MNKSIYFLSAIALSGFVASCDIQDNVTTTEDLENASVVIEDQSDVQLNSIAIFENVNNFGFSQSTNKSLSSTEPTASWSGNTLTLDYTGVTNASGKIVVEFSGIPVLHQGLTASITFENYVSNGTSMTGEMELGVLAFTASPQFSYKSVGALTIKKGTNAAYQWTFDQTVVWAEGYNTPLVSTDDTYYFEGNSQQVTGGVTNKMEIQEKVVYSTNCEFLKEGIIKFTNAAGTNNEFVANADFSVGSATGIVGECDGYVKIYSGLIQITINLAE
jgi:hypothetical protein